jgi:hypothetical protein
MVLCNTLLSLLTVCIYVLHVQYLVFFKFVFQGEIIVVDGQAVPIKRFITDLHQNESLRGRPKVLIFECCRGERVMTGRIKSPMPEDFYILYSTSSGCVSATDYNKGSPFVKVLGESLLKHYMVMSLQDIFKGVKEKVSEMRTTILDPASGVPVASKQVPDERSTLKKKLFLSMLAQTLLKFLKVVAFVDIIEVKHNLLILKTHLIVHYKNCCC